jgi:hypothetical protein
MTLPAAAFLLAVVTCVLPPSAGATTIMVPPGTGTLQAAVDAAAPGDALFLTGGLYSGAVTVAKSDLTMRVPRFAGAVIDAGCASPTALTISGSNVRLIAHRGEFVVQGATDTDVSVSGSTNVKLNPVTAQAMCGSENYGFDVATSARLRLKVASTGTFAKAGLRLHDVTGPVTLGTNFRAVLGSLVIEDSGMDTRPGKSGIRIEVGMPAAPVAVSLLNAHAILFKSSLFGDVQIDALSGNNEFAKCEGFSTFTDLGTGDCGRDNTGFTLPPCS